MFLVRLQILLRNLTRETARRLSSRLQCHLAEDEAHFVRTGREDGTLYWVDRYGRMYPEGVQDAPEER